MTTNYKISKASWTYYKANRAELDAKITKLQNEVNTLTEMIEDYGCDPDSWTEEDREQFRREREEAADRLEWCRYVRTRLTVASIKPRIRS